MDNFQYHSYLAYPKRCILQMIRTHNEITIFPLFSLHSLSGGIQTVDLRFMSRVFYHCATITALSEVFVQQPEHN